MPILDDEAAVDDAGFFAQLSRDLPDLAPVHDAADRGDWPRARQLLAHYFRTRAQPRWTFDWRGPGQLDRFVDRSHMWGCPQLAPLQERADALLVNEFVDGAGVHHDISDLPAFLQGLRFGEQAQYITMFIWAMDLGEMYARTADNRYAQAFAGLFVACDDAFPRVVTNHDPDHPWLDETIPPTWHEMFVGKAAIHLLSVFYSGMLDDPAVGTDVVFRVIRKLWFHAAQFTRFTDVRSFKHFNHHWYERGTCPFVLGIMLPEFAGFPQMFERGREVINDHLQRDFFDDGTYREHSVSYQSSTLAVDLLFPWSVAHANGVPLVDECNLPVVQSWLAWYAGMTQPDGELPAIGDAYGARSINRLACAAALAGDATLKGFVVSLAEYATPDPNGSTRDNALGLQDTLLPAWEALAAAPSATASVVFPQGGWAALRDGGDRNATYCALSAINSPDGRNHGHWDLLHFTFFARGRSLLADPASWIYNGYYNAERRGYMYSMAAHNILTIDDDQLLSKRQLSPIWTGDVPSCSIRASALTDRIDFVSASHDAYAPQRHTREIFFVKQRYVVVLDHITSADTDWIHTYRRLLHFDFDVDVQQRDGHLLAQCGDAALSCVPQADGDVQLTTRRDDYLEPERRKLGCSELPWITEVRSEQAGSTVMAMLLHPHAAGTDPPLSIDRVPVSSEGVQQHPSAAVAYRVVTPHGTDIICRNFGAAEVHFDNVSTAAPIWASLSADTSPGWSGAIWLS